MMLAEAEAIAARAQLPAKGWMFTACFLEALVIRD